MKYSSKMAVVIMALLGCGQALAHGHHDHGTPLTEVEQKAAEGIFTLKDVKDRPLADWEGVWESVNGYLLSGDLDPVFRQKAEKQPGKTFAEIKEYYRKGYATDVNMIGIENGVMEFHVGDKVSTCEYRYSGHKVLTYVSGKQGVRYLFECQQANTGAPKYVQFSDHIIAPRKICAFPYFYGQRVTGSTAGGNG
ncbi:Cadmium-induced protein ZinT [Kluyvera cryocrescens]|uniref:Cadmium-induced protein ZinT n=1 Tax=Kluyvera cryocrescens TaxID=580 RepID=A0A485D4Z1_KLUCR|nr:Cadmium-induced protein ZinT [Kluyvera cryocrescens]